MLGERVAKDTALLSFLGEMLFRSAKLVPSASSAVISSKMVLGEPWQVRSSWYAATVIAAIEASEHHSQARGGSGPSEDFLRVLLPQLAKGINFNITDKRGIRSSFFDDDLLCVRVACYTVAVRLAAAQAISDDACNLLLLAVIKSAAPKRT